MDQPVEKSPLTEPALPEEVVSSPDLLLPTLQRNALRKIFDRTVFSPEEVAALGYRRLRMADGIGEKGIKTIIVWLAEHGYELAPEPSMARRLSRRSGVWTIQSAMRLLRSYGYEISAPAKQTIGALPAGKKRTRFEEAG